MIAHLHEGGILPR